MWIYFLMAFMDLENTDVKVVSSFQPPSGEEYLSFPYSAVFSPQNKLYVVDRTQSRILVWNADRSFDKGFGRRGEGPGELFQPSKIVATRDRIYIWEDHQQVSVFDHEGGFIESFKIPGIIPRQMAVLDENRLVIGYRFIDALDRRMIFKLIDGNGKELSVLKEFKNEAFLTPNEGDNHVTIKGFAPEIDLQEHEGSWYFGFSQNKTLYQINGKGEIVGQKLFRIPTGKATAEEEQLVLNLSFVLPSGEKITMKDLPNVKVSFDYDKAYYTHFLIKGDRIAFILTPIGSTDSIGNGFYRATYVVNDFKTGEILSRGRYVFPEDSVVLYRNGRAIAFLINDQDAYEVKEIALKGLK